MLDLTNIFIDSLPNMVRCTDFKERGTFFKYKEKALDFKYIELNQFYKKFLAFDLDYAGSVDAFMDHNLPPPTFIAKNRKNAHCLYLYALNDPVIYTENGRRKPQKLYEDIDISFGNILKNDDCFAGRLVKNILSPEWELITYNKIYDLLELLEYVNTREHVFKRKEKIHLDFSSRNCTVFNTGRHWAYREVYLVENFCDFKEKVENKCFEINTNLYSKTDYGILPYKEVQTISNSISRWTWNKYLTGGLGGSVNRGVMAPLLTNDMTLQEKQAISAERTNSIRTSDTQTKLAIAVAQLKSQGTPITQKSLSIASGLSLRAVQNYWKKIQK